MGYSDLTYILELFLWQPSTAIRSAMPQPQGHFHRPQVVLLNAPHHITLSISENLPMNQ